MAYLINTGLATPTIIRDNNSTITIGRSAGNNTYTGTNSLGIGPTSLAALTSGTANVGTGSGTLKLITTTSNNTALGYNAGSAFAGHSSCLFLGASADATAGTLTNAIAIGAAASVTTSNSMVLGNGCNVGIGTSSPLNPLHVIGKIQQKGITSNWTGTDIIKGQTSVQTTNSTVTTLLTVAVPNAINTAIAVKVVVLGFTTDGDLGAYGESLAGAANYTGNVTAEIGTLPTVTLTKDGGAAFAAQWSVSGTNLLFRVTGLVATNVNWVCRYEYHAVTTSTS